jgi:hypothetical protein
MLYTLESCYNMELSGEGQNEVVRTILTIPTGEECLVDRCEKILQKMRSSSTGIRFADVVSLPRHKGFVLFTGAAAIARSIGRTVGS